MNLSPWPSYSLEEAEAAKNIILSGQVNYWTGDKGKSFENEYADWSNCKYALTMANGTLALTAAYKAIGLKESDEIITTPRTFIATTSAAALTGANPVFADVDRDSGAITVESIEPLINKKTKAISVVHLGGWPADMVKICQLAKSYNLFVIEDCSQAHGAKIAIDKKLRSVGSFGNIGTWSFCQDKIITTGGEGGMVTTNDKNLWEQMWSYRDHGKGYDSFFRRDHPPGYRWVTESFGTNFRMTEIQSEIGRIQLKKMDSWNKIRKENAIFLYENLKDLSILRIPMPSDNLKHAWYKFYVYLKPEYISSDWNRSRILEEINACGYKALTGSCSEVYLESCFKDKSFCPSIRLPIAKELGETSLMFLVHPGIHKEEMYNYVETIKKILYKATL